ncbi:prolactin-releasing peptide receptor-like [Paramacrobiotus metropolitanus]|uniref:prolactin-releasing peptide receptor-like n=1 Tax=Paramacrobiotus metropolitanus TaxID=2943436 RepID=UPI0024459BA8|nr:prolactin-releasing peptide receptor-like [Paramacrobiotus metropolitanus]
MAESQQDLIFNPFIATVLCSLYILLLIGGLIGNIALLFAVISRSALRRSSAHCLIANIALVHCFLCLTSIPFTVLPPYLGGWYFGWIACHVAFLVTSAAVINLALTIITLAAERYYSVIHCQQDFVIFSSRYVCVTVFLIWITANLISLPYAAYASYETNSNTTAVPQCSENFPDTPRKIFWTTTFLMTFSIPFLIGLVIYRSVFISLAQTVFMEKLRSVSVARDAAAERRTSLVALKISVMLGVCWLPLHLMNALYDFAGISLGRYGSTLHLAVHIIALTSVVLLPIICFRGDESFRASAGSALKKKEVDNGDKKPTPFVTKSQNEPLLEWL